MKADNSTMTIQELEYAIVAKNFAEAERILIYLTTVYTEDKVELTAAPFNRALTKEQKVLESYQVIEKLATLITTWFSDWSYTPSKETYAFICLQKSFINNLFSASSYHSTDHILANLELVDKTDYTPEQLRRLLFVITVETAIDVPWSQLFQHLPDISVLAYSGQIRSISIQMSHRAKRNITHLVEAAKDAPMVYTDDVENLSPLIATYFNCSNLADPNKYEIKKWIVKCIDAFMDRSLTPGLHKRIKSDVKIIPDMEKPTVLVINEFYFDKHAMYRGYRPRIAALKERFHTIGVGVESQFDKLGQKDFHETIVIPDEDKLKLDSIIKKIIKCKPDIVYYPSVGMTIFAPFLASRRLAPIQVVSGGHPASTYLSSIDYFHTADFHGRSDNINNIITETWLPHKRENLVRKEIKFNLKETDLNSSVANIAINGVIQKISSELIETCKKISIAANRKVIFHFFMAHPKQDIEFFAAQSLLRRFLPNSSLHPFSNYNNYMSILNDCLFALGTFPFGGTNSNVDLIKLIKPKLFVVDESDISGLTDYDIWASVGYVSGECRDNDELIGRAVSWVNDERLLNIELKKMKDADLMSKILTEENTLEPQLAELFSQIIEQKVAGHE